MLVWDCSRGSRPTIIKLDMDLVRGLDTSLPRRMIVEGVVRMALSLGITLIAEGMETARPNMTRCARSACDTFKAICWPGPDSGICPQFRFPIRAGGTPQSPENRAQAGVSASSTTSNS